MESPASPAIDQAAAAPAAATTTHRLRTDTHLWGTYMLLVIIAIIELFSASIQEVSGEDIFAPVIRHGVFIVLGLGIMLFLQHIHYRYIFRAIPLFVTVCVAAMVMVNWR